MSLARFERALRDHLTNRHHRTDPHGHPTGIHPRDFASIVVDLYNDSVGSLVVEDRIVPFLSEQFQHRFRMVLNRQMYNGVQGQVRFAYMDHEKWYGELFDDVRVAEPIPINSEFYPSTWR